MIQARIIPCLLISGNKLVKTKKFQAATYLGDPVNTVRIFSEKEADEIVVLDIDASRSSKEPNFNLIAEMAGEAYMPMAYGGGIRTIGQIRRLIRSGVEKVVINTLATETMETIREAVDTFGSQAIVGAIDVRRNLLNRYTVVAKSATVKTGLELKKHVANLMLAGVGELFVNDVDRDGCMRGYDLDLVRQFSEASVPVVVCGGAGALEHLRDAVKVGGATAAAAGSMFVFHGTHRAVLINYPRYQELQDLFKGYDS